MNTTDTYTTSFNNFLKLCKAQGQHVISTESLNNLTEQDRQYVSDVYTGVCTFLSESNLTPADRIASIEEFTEPITKLSNIDPNYTSISFESLSHLIEHAARINESMRPAAYAAIGQTLANASGKSPSSILQNHFTSPKFNLPTNANQLSTDFSNIYSKTVSNELKNMSSPETAYRVAVESFGAEIDKVLPDIRLNMTVKLIEFNKSIVDRLMPRRATTSPAVTYVVPWSETYDLEKTNSTSGEEREGRHHIPVIDLLSNPTPVNASLIRIEPLLKNDVDNNYLYDAGDPNKGMLLFGVDINLFDMARDVNRPQYAATNLTDLVADGAILEKLIVSVKSNDTEELFVIDTTSYSGSRFNRSNNTRDSGDRFAHVRDKIKLSNTTTTSSGATSTILATCTDTDYLVLSFDVKSFLSYKTSLINTSGGVTINAHNKNGDEVSEPVKTLLENVSVELVAYDVKAEYNEENFRKTNIAIRSQNMIKTVEIVNGKNYLVDYSLNQTLPEFVMNDVARVSSLGQDDRALRMIEDAINVVNDRLTIELDDVSYKEVLSSLSHEYVAGMRVRPRTILGVLDCDAVQTVRTGDAFGDLRTFADVYFNKIFADLMKDTFYDQSLDPGEKIVFKVVTSFPILASILSAPHYHNLTVNKDQSSPSGDIDYLKVLPNGIELEIITTVIDRYKDKIIFIPYRRSQPESDLTFGHNWDIGSFLAHYTPTIMEGAWKRVFLNKREMPYVTNPIGGVITVLNLDKKTDKLPVNTTVTVEP